MAHRKGHFDSTTFRRMRDRFNEEQLRNKDSDIVGEKLDFPEFSYRGKDAYNRGIQAGGGISDPYIGDGKVRKYPLLSSKHFAGDFVHNPMSTDIRNREAMTLQEQKKAIQDRITSGGFAQERGPAYEATARSLSYFGSEFDKRSEKQAKIANERSEYLRNIALNEGEEALYNALDKERMAPNKNGVMINRGRLVEELFPMGETKASRDLRGNYAANPAGQSLKNINDFENISNQAIDAQDEFDYYRDFFARGAKRPLKDNYFDTRGGQF